MVVNECSRLSEVREEKGLELHNATGLLSVGTWECMGRK